MSWVSRMLQPIQKGPICRAAIRRNGVIWSVPQPGRHHDVIRRICKVDGVRHVTGTQGFVTKKGSFLDRGTAYYLALSSGQLKEPTRTPGTLYSEDLW